MSRASPHGGTILFGGSGFLGSYILRQDPSIVSVGRSAPAAPNRHIPVPALSDLSCLEEVPFDRVIFAVGHSDHYALEEEKLRPGEPTAFDYHLTPLIQTLEQLKHRGIRQFIHFSTVLLYDAQRAALPAAEDAAIDPYRNRYVLSMHLAEQAAHYYRCWMPVSTMRLANVYGPTSRPRWDLVHQLVTQLVEGGQAEMWNTGTARDFIYAEDAAAAVLRVLVTDHCGVLNTGSGVATPVERVKAILEAISGFVIRVLNRPVQGPVGFSCDVTKLRQVAGWEPRVSIEEGIRRTYEAMRSCHPHAAGR